VFIKLFLSQMLTVVILCCW